MNKGCVAEEKKANPGSVHESLKVVMGVVSRDDNMKFYW